MEHLYNLTFTQYLGIFAMIYGGARIVFHILLIRRNKRNYKAQIKDLEFDHCPAPPSPYNILKVDEEKMERVISSKRPIGLFYAFDNSNSVYLGCDNSTGDAWVEEFRTKAKCMRWLFIKRKIICQEIQKK